MLIAILSICFITTLFFSSTLTLYYHSHPHWNMGMSELSRPQGFSLQRCGLLSRQLGNHSLEQILLRNSAPLLLPGSCRGSVSWAEADTLCVVG